MSLFARAGGDAGRRVGRDVRWWSLARVGVLAAVVVSLGLATVAVMRPTSEAAPPPEPTPSMPMLDAAVRFVEAWLHADEIEDLAEFVEMNGASVDFSGASTPVVVRVADAEPFVRGWAITLSVTATVDVAGTAFYRVELVRDDRDVWSPTGFPAAVAAPLELEPTRVIRAGRPDLDDERVAVVHGWLLAYLTGGADPARYTTPDLDIAALSPSPYVVVEVLSAEVSGGSASPVISTDVLAITSTGDEVAMSYQFELTGRDGRWEIAALFPRAVQRFGAAAAPAAEPDRESSDVEDRAQPTTTTTKESN